MTVARSILLFILAAIAEIGGAWLIWQGVREHRGSIWIGAGIVALGVYGFVATLQPDSAFGRILAAYGGIFVTGAPGGMSTGSPSNIAGMPAVANGGRGGGSSFGAPRYGVKPKVMPSIPKPIIT